MSGESGWAESGFTPDEAREFRRWRFTLAQAVAWRRAGVSDGLQAAQWVVAGVTPDSVAGWHAAGIDASQAVRWHEFGFGLEAAADAIRRGQTPDAAFASHAVRSSGLGPAAFAYARGVRGDVIRKFLEAGVPHQVMREYLFHHWDADEALPWARAGVSAAEALVWQALGLSAVEAGRLARKGAGALETMREWWRAGIPLDEVADWIGAGLTAAEAVSQRARGVTAEQAAALRALRGQEDDDLPG